MNPRRRFFVLAVGASLLGLAASELLYRFAAFRDFAGRLAGRGHLIAITHGKGIYQADLQSGDEAAAPDLVALENLRHQVAHEKIDAARVDREIALFQAQFGTDAAFQKAMRDDGLSVSVLREAVANHLRGLDWLEKQVRPAVDVTEQESRVFYDAHPGFFAQPVRYRAAHLFLAAHAETPPEVIQEKETAITDLATRLSAGEEFSAIAVEASEDEASKPRGGDLGYFAETRLPPDFIAEIKKMTVGQVSKPFRSHLGFHFAQLTDLRPARLLSFDEARPEIAMAMLNERRSRQVALLNQSLSRASR